MRRVRTLTQEKSLNILARLQSKQGCVLPFLLQKLKVSSLLRYPAAVKHEYPVGKRRIR